MISRISPGSTFPPARERARYLAAVATVLVLLAGCGEAPGDDPSDSATAGEVPVDSGRGLDVVPPHPDFPFTDVTAASGVDFVHHNGAAGRRHYVETMAPGVALFDADGDGDPDLYAVDGAPLPGTPPGPPTPNRLYLNRGDGTFEDATETSGAGDTGYGMGVTVGDWDGDGDEDLYVLNYGPNVLYENLGDGRFRPVTAGVEDPRWSVSGAFLDHDGDGDLDLWVVNYLDYDVHVEQACTVGDLEIYCSPELFPPLADRLYRNDGDGTFTDVSRQAGIVEDGRGMGLAVGDLDLDGDPEVYVANDCTPNHLYVNEGGRFREEAAVAGVGFSTAGHTEGGMGVVMADLVEAGRPSLFHTNFHKEPNRLFVPAGSGFFDDRTLPSGLGFPSIERVSWGIAALDVEGDGDLDLAVANGHVFDNAAEFIAGSRYEQPDQLFLATGGGRFEARDFPGPPLSSRGLAAGDLDGDGDADLVVAAAGDRLRVWRNDAGDPHRFLLIDLRAEPPNPRALGARLVARVAGRDRSRQVQAGGSYASHGDPRIALGLGEAGVAERLEVHWPDGTVEALEDVAGGRAVTWRQGRGIVAETPLVGAGGDR